MNKLKKRKLQLLTLCTAFTGLTLGVLFFSGKGLGSFSPKVSAGSNYILNLNYSNGGSSFSSTYVAAEQTNTSAKTNKGSEIDFKYSNVKKSNNNYAVVANNGYLYNSTRLTGLETVVVNFSGSLSIYTSSSTTFSGSGATLTSGSEFQVNAGDDYFKVVSSGETTISSIVATYKCSPRYSYYEKIESNDDLTDGTYLIVYETGSSVFNGSGTTASDMCVPQSVTISDKKIAATSEVDSYSIEISDNLSTIQTASGKYIGGTNGSNTINVSNNKVTNSVSIESNGDADIVSNTSHVRYNVSATQFKYFKSATYSNQSAVALYRKGSGSSGGGGGGDVEDIFTTTINKDNCGLPVSAGSSDVERSYLLSDGETTLDVVFSAGAYVYNETAIRLNNSYLEPKTASIYVTKITIDFYASGQNYIVVTANGETVTGTDSETTGSGVVKDFEINSETWRIATQESKFAGIYSITIYCQVDTGPKAVSGVSLNKTELELTTESSETLIATVAPDNAENKNVSWSSADESIANVDENGIVSGAGAGSTTITVTTEDGGFTAICTVTVKTVVHVSSVSLNKSGLSMNPNDDEVLTATVLPSNASDKSVTWTTSNSSVATVSDGTVHAVGAGSATITVTTNDGNHTATCAVTVTNVSVTGVSLDQSAISITRLSNQTLYATVAPSNATNKNVTWTSSNISVATVTNGTVSALAIGSTTITVRTEDGGYTATCTVTVTPIQVTGISLNKDSTGIYVGYSETLVATVTPSNADSQTVTWTSSNTAVATVTNSGTVNALSVGTTVITASCSTFSDTCTVSVTEEPASIEYSLVTELSQISTGLKVIIASEDGGKAISTTQNTNNRAGTDVTISSNQISEESLSSSVEVFTLEAGTKANTYAFHGKNGYIYAANSSSNQMKTQSSIDDNASFSISVTSAGVATITAQGSNSRNTIRYNPNGGTPIFACYASSSTTGSLPQLYIEPSEPVDPTSIELPATESMSTIGTKTLEVTYYPANCNQNKGVTWSSSNTTVATIDSSTGVITPKKAGQTTITATSTFNSNFTSSCVLTVSDNMDEWTILMYVCGADLESDSDQGGAATEDLGEIAKVSGQPSDVNIVVQAGGASRWENTYSSVINKDNANRFHLRDKSYVKDQQFSKVNMGLESSFKDFLVWGINTFPAQKIGVILWNHGGAMDGCCFDEQFSDDSLTPLEAHDAIVDARQETGYTRQFEFIGYDCCLMQVQDIAGLNSEYAKYQVASEESEWGYGWTYDEWVDNLYNKESTTSILKAIVDSFASETTSTYNSWGYTNDQTLSYLDLSKWAAYETAFENVASTLSSSIVTNSTKWNTFKGYVNQAQKYGQFDPSDYPNLSGYNNGYVYDVFDVGNVITKLRSGYSSQSALVSQLNTLQTAYNNLVAYEWHGSGAGNSSGMTLFCPISGYNSSSYYGTSGMTTLTTWQSFVVSLGNWY